MIKYILFFCLLFASTVLGEIPIYPGNVLITRNASNNRSLGYWNHCAIYIGDNKVIEAQIKPGKVIVSELNEFWGRYPNILLIKIIDDKQSLEAVNKAKELIGAKYRPAASMFCVLRDKSAGENCVSVVRKCYISGTGKDPLWKLPDDVARFGTLVYEKTTR